MGMTSPRDLRQEALDNIERMLQQGELCWGDRVSEVAIAQKIGMSRTPVREALQVFTEMGLFKRLPRFGTIVRIPEVREIEDLFNVRAVLEGYAIELAAQSITADALAGIANACDRMDMLVDSLHAQKTAPLSPSDITILFTADRDFHEGIVRATGNHVLLKHINDNRLLVRLLSFRISNFREINVRNLAREHRGIYNALKSGDAAAAKSLLTAHIMESKGGTAREIKKHLDQLASQGNTGLGLYFRNS